MAEPRSEQNGSAATAQNMTALSGILRSSSECGLNCVKVYVKEVSLCDDSSFISRLSRFSVF
jgi:hypothetical protein